MVVLVDGAWGLRVCGLPCCYLLWFAFWTAEIVDDFRLLRHTYALPHLRLHVGWEGF